MLILSVNISISFIYNACFLCSWTGEEALRELQEASISQQSFPILEQCATGVSNFCSKL